MLHPMVVEQLCNADFARTNTGQQLRRYITVDMLTQLTETN